MIGTPTVGPPAQVTFRTIKAIMLQHILNFLLFAVIPLTLAGIGAHLATETLPVGSSRRRNIVSAVWVLAFIGIVSGILVEVLNAKTDKRKEAEATELKAKIDSVGRQNDLVLRSLLASKPVTESERRQQIENALRGEYIIHHDPIDPLILSGDKYPPAEWMNQRLKQMGEPWNISPPSGPISTERKQRSYLVVDGSPVYPSNTASPGEIKAGSLVIFNVTFHNTGPNPVVVRRTLGEVMLLTGYDAATQTKALADFLVYAKGKPMIDGSTVNPGEHFFKTFSTRDSADPLHLLAFTDAMVDELHAGRLIAFVFVESDYEDQGKLHHERKCSFLQPPASTIDPIFHTCSVFGKSD